MSAVDVFIPAAGWNHGIDLGSGIVGQPQPTHTGGPGRTLIYYEGNRFGYSNVKTWCDRVMIAAGRLQERYPTIARSWVVPDSLTRVGIYDGLGLIELDHPSLRVSVCNWISCTDDELDEQLTVSEVPAWMYRARSS